jgi:hypothetical protein
MRASLRIAAICSFAAALLLAGGAPARAQAQDQAQNKDQAQSKDQAQAKDQEPAKDPATSSGQPDTQSSNSAAGAEPQAAPQQDSLAEAARKAREKKGKQDPPKVYTEEEMSKLSSHGVSVVGEGNAGGGNSSDGGYSPRGNTPRDQEEAYWRSRARNLLNQMSATDAQIEQMKEEIKKYGNGGFDPATGLTKNVIYFQDRQAQLDHLQKHRGDLDRQMDQLQEEGRKAGASPSWFR